MVGGRKTNRRYVGQVNIPPDFPQISRNYIAQHYRVWRALPDYTNQSDRMEHLKRVLQAIWTQRVGPLFSLATNPEPQTFKFGVPRVVGVWKLFTSCLRRRFSNLQPHLAGESTSQICFFSECRPHSYRLKKKKKDLESRTLVWVVCIMNKYKSSLCPFSYFYRISQTYYYIIKIYCIQQINTSPKPIYISKVKKI